MSHKPPHILIVEARYYADISDHLLAGATGVLAEAGATYDRIEVPGSLEIPAAIRFAHETGRYDGYIALGCIIRGETTHYDLISVAVTNSLQRLALKRMLAIGDGVLVGENYDQVLVRANGSKRNQGEAAARACMALVGLKREFKVA